MATSMMTTVPQFTGLRPQLKPSPVQGLVINHLFHIHQFSILLLYFYVQISNNITLFAQVASQSMTKRKGKGALGVRCDFIGSSTNVVRSQELDPIPMFL